MTVQTLPVEEPVQEIVALPVEVAQIARNVSVEKQSEVQKTLNDVFTNVAQMRQKLDLVVVSDHNDQTSMKLANTIRLGVKKVRLDAEKFFDKKREEVQAQMVAFKTEDQLWLKAKQVMQILTKEIEAQAEFKEDTRVRFLEEQKQLKLRERELKVLKVAENIPTTDYSHMSDDSFLVFLSGLEKAHQEKIEAAAKAEAERIERERLEAEERERVRVENERLKRQIEEDRAKAEVERKEAEVKAAAERAKAEAARKEAEEKAKLERAATEAKLKAEAEARAKAEAELFAKKEAERKELEVKAEAERKRKNAPDKEKLEALAKSVDDFQLPEVSGEEAKKVVEDVKKLLTKVSNYVREKNATL